MIRRPPRSTLFPTRRSSDLALLAREDCSRPALVADARRAIEMAPKVRSEEHSLNSSHRTISYAVFCLKKKKETPHSRTNKRCPSAQYDVTPATCLYGYTTKA